MTLRKWQLPRNVYDVDAWLVFGTARELNAFFVRLKYDDGHIGPQVRAQYDTWEPDDPGEKERHYISVVRERLPDNRDDRLAILAHELVHFVFAALSERGIICTHENDEPFAYFYEWTFRECARYLR